MEHHPDIYSRSLRSSSSSLDPRMCLSWPALAFAFAILLRTSGIWSPSACCREPRYRNCHEFLTWRLPQHTFVLRSWAASCLSNRTSRCSVNCALFFVSVVPFYRDVSFEISGVFVLAHPSTHPASWSAFWIFKEVLRWVDVWLQPEVIDAFFASVTEKGSFRNPRITVRVAHPS